MVWTNLLRSLLLLSTLSAFSNGLKIPVERRAPRGVSITSPSSGSRYSFGSTTDKEQVSNIGDMRYTTNITINSVDVLVALDTGSTDLWVIPPGGVGKFNDTGIPIDLAYGDGSYGVEGTIGVSPFSFGAYSVPEQAFMNGVTSTITGLSDINVYGILGLSFDFNAASPINGAIKAKYGPDATWGRSVLQNIFLEHPDQRDFIAIDLSRTDDLEDTAGGSFYIGEYDPQWAEVVNSPKLAQSPVGGHRWTVLLDGVTVDGTSVPLISTIAGVPAGSAQALLDTGDPTGILPTALLDGIYSKIPGALKYSDGGTDVWLVPCNTTSIVELEFGGIKYPIHPLDLTTLTDPLDIGTQEYTACVAAFKGADGWGGDEYDISLGDSFLRNVYAVFDFGDDNNTSTTTASSGPFIQLLSELDVAKAQAQVQTIRAKTLQGKPPTIDPAQLIALLNGPSDTTTTNTDETGSSLGVKSKVKSATSDLISSSSNTITLDSQDIKTWGIIGIALLGANLIVGLVLVAFAVLGCVKKGRARKSALAPSSSGAPHYVPVKSKEVDNDGYSGTYNQPYNQGYTGYAH